MDGDSGLVEHIYKYMRYARSILIKRPGQQATCERLTKKTSGKPLSRNKSPEEEKKTNKQKCSNEKV